MKIRRGILIILALIFIIFILIIKIKSENIKEIAIHNNTLEFDSLSLKQKLAQMIIIYGDDRKNIKLTKLNIGGILLNEQKTEEDYKSLINEYQENSKIKLFVTADVEGAWNPFSNFFIFPTFSEINTSEEAYETGLKEGKLLREIGFNLNFAPVSEFYDNSYGDRTFLGTKEGIKEKLKSYINGLQKNVNGTCKHYPGRGMINNLHDKIDIQNISKEDLELFQVCFDNNISAIMVGHQIVYGEIDSNKKPSSVSPELIDNIKNFSVLIVSDEINMRGLSYFYKDKSLRYEELINSGENLILDSKLNYISLSLLLNKLESAVKKGDISEEKINESVKKILIAKGYSPV